MDVGHSVVICPLCEDDGDSREVVEEREGVGLCVWHVLAYDLNAPTEIRERVRAEAGS